ncbi:MAG: lyase family protein [Candidatus Omnitrophica bacterium]|nr:lyase family protein [Candidatus Omnitrophota bacterium]
MIERYSLPKMAAIWQDKFKFQKMFDIELLVIEALAKYGKIPQPAAKRIKKKAKFDPNRIKKIEGKTQHDVVAFVTNIAQYIGKDAQYLHLGLTSSDILDTALALQMRQAADILIEDIQILLDTLKERAKKYRISPKEGGNITKPSEWENVDDDDFLDPVNYRYPCPNADQTRAAAAYWGKPENQEQYSTKERAIINERLEEKKKKFKIGEFALEKGGSKMREFYEKLKSLVLGAEKEFSDPEKVKFTEEDLMKKVKEAEERAFSEAQKKIDEEKAKKEEALKKLIEFETKAKKDEIHQFCESLIKEGKFAPSWQKMGIEEFILSLDKEGTMKFAEQEKSQAQWFLDFLVELPKVITFKEVTPPEGPGVGSNAGEKLNTLIKKKIEQGKTLSYSAAFLEVQKENPELAKEYREEIFKRESNL